MIELNVSGMSCGHCVKAVTQAIQQQLPAAQVDVQLATGQVSITNLPQSDTATTDALIEQISAAIRDEGYQVTTTVRN